MSVSTESSKTQQLNDAKQEFAAKLAANKFIDRPQKCDSENNDILESSQNWGFPPNNNNKNDEKDETKDDKIDEKSDDSKTDNIASNSVNELSCDSHPTHAIPKLTRNDDASRSRHGLLHLSNFHDSTFELSLPPSLVLVSDLDHTLIGRNSEQNINECDIHLKVMFCFHLIFNILLFYLFVKYRNLIIYG